MFTGQPLNRINIDPYLWIWKDFHDVIHEKIENVTYTTSYFMYVYVCIEKNMGGYKGKYQYYSWVFQK